MSSDVEVIQVVRTRLMRRGRGLNSDDPIRIITQYWSLEGELLAEVDPHPTIVQTRVFQSVSGNA